MNEPTLTPPTGDDRPFFSRTVLKMGGIGALALIMLIPLALTLPVVRERMERRDLAVESIQSGWGNRQTLVGPVLVLPFRSDATDGSPQVVRNAFVLPESFAAEGTLVPEKRWRGIYQGVVFTAKVTLHGTFRAPDLAALGIPADRVLWDQAYVAVALSDLRGVEDAVFLDWGGTKLKLRPGARLADWPAGLHTPVGPLTGEVAFHAVLPFRGSGALDVAPVGAASRVSVESSWPHPSFVGAFLPSTREVGANGFHAEWRASAYGRQLPQQWVDGDGPGLRALSATLFGVELLVGVDSYRSVERATKYGVLIIALVFMTFFLFEILAGSRIHPFQYGLVGVGIALFFLLLLALSEVLSFTVAYGAAAGAIVVLLSLYTYSILRHRRRAIVSSLGLSACFGLLYVILQAEDYALLAGSLALFAALAILMRLTRQIDWYARDAVDGASG